MASDHLLEPEEAREQYFWGTLLRVLATLLIILLVLGVLAALTALLGWRPFLLLSFLGLLAGASVTVALSGSARSRELTALVLGAVTLPLLAAYLGGVAVRDDVAFGAYSASLFPFLAHASGAVLGGVGISRVWAGRPGRPEGVPP
jgi:hypothetical protein